MIKHVWGFLFVCMFVPVYAGMAGGMPRGRIDNMPKHRRVSGISAGSPMMARNQKTGGVVTTDVVPPAPSPESVTDTALAPEPVPETGDTIATDVIPPAPEPEPVPEPEPDYTAEIALASEYIEQLQAEIKQIDSEMLRCRRVKNNWTIGTIVGGAGVVGTATGAIVQAVKINKAKKNGATVSDKSTDAEQKGDAE